jgi:hypothetical protein
VPIIAPVGNVIEFSTFSMTFRTNKLECFFFFPN